MDEVGRRGERHIGTLYVLRNVNANFIVYLSFNVCETSAEICLCCTAAQDLRAGGLISNFVRLRCSSLELYLCKTLSNLGKACYFEFDGALIVQAHG